MSEKAPKRKRSAWFAFYPDDFSGGTRSMSLAARGAFVELLGHQFANGSIPPDDRTLCRIVGAFPDEWAEIREEVLAKFEEDESGNFINRRMQKEREEREGIREKRIEASKAGNQKRWQKDPKWDRKTVPNGIANGYALGVATTTTTTSLDSSKEESASDTRGEVDSPIMESETLAMAGKSLESISTRLAIPAENLIEHGKTLGLTEGQVRQWADNRVSSGWCNPKGKALTLVTWPADMNNFAATFNQIQKQQHGTNRTTPSRNDGTANAGRASAFANIGKHRP